MPRFMAKTEDCLMVLFAQILMKILEINSKMINSGLLMLHLRYCGSS